MCLFIFGVSNIKYQMLYLQTQKENAAADLLPATETIWLINLFKDVNVCKVKLIFYCFTVTELWLVQKEEVLTSQRIKHDLTFCWEPGRRRVLTNETPVRISFPG